MNDSADCVDEQPALDVRGDRSPGRGEDPFLLTRDEVVDAPGETGSVVEHDEVGGIEQSSAHLAATEGERAQEAPVRAAELETRWLGGRGFVPPPPRAR